MALRRPRPIEWAATAASSGYLRWAYAVAGRTEEAGKILEKLRSLTLEEGGRSSITALVLFGLGRTDETYELFKRCLVERDTVLFIVAIDPAFKRLRTDPRWAPIVRELETLRSSR